MKVKMRTLAAGPNGNLEPGQIYEVPDGVGRAFVSGGYAENADPVVKEPARETATGRGQGGEASGKGAEASVKGTETSTKGKPARETATGRGQGGG